MALKPPLRNHGDRVAGTIFGSAPAAFWVGVNLEPQQVDVPINDSWQDQKNAAIEDTVQTDTSFVPLV